MKVYLAPNQSQISPNNGIGRVVAAQFKYLPEFGVDFVDQIDQADLVFCHAAAADLPRVDIMQCHGLYFEDIPHMRYIGWHYEANRRITHAARQAKVITVPSRWVATPFLRDMRRVPKVIPHGIELDEWQRDENRGFILWNKGRMDDVCDPTPALELAKAGLLVVSTFIPYTKREFIPPNITVTGALPAHQMKRLIQAADIYLATTLETFGIGTLEAMACGVPVLGYAWGGILDIVEHKVTGYLAKPNDIGDLIEGYTWIKAHYKSLASQARAVVQNYTWLHAIEQYWNALQEANTPEADGVAVVIPCYNYGRFVGEAVKSVMEQSSKVQEIVVVDDGSTDNSREVITALAKHYPITPIFQENQGVAAARNHGIEATTSPFIICLDADDQLHKEYVRLCRTALKERRDLGVVYTGLRMLNEDGSPSPIETDWPPEFKWGIQAQVTNPPANCIASAAMFRRALWEAAGGYHQRYAPGEDTELWTRGLSMGFDARRVTHEKLFLYRAHAGSASRTKPYKPIDDDKPWMRPEAIDPLGAPERSGRPKKVYSYALPLISVILPVGPGHTAHVYAALESLLAQSFRLWEVVLVDDTIHTTQKDGKLGFSTEFSLGALEQYPFVHYIPNLKGNHGAGAARNLGIQSAQAPLLFFLDADDFLQPDALEELLRKWIEFNGQRYTYGDWFLDTGKQVETHPSMEYSQGEWTMQHPVSVLIPRADVLEVGCFDEKMTWAEDHELFLKLAIAGRCGQRVPKPLLTYRAALGQRRQLLHSDDDRKAMIDLMRSRHGEYFSGNGGKKMGSCCGGSSAAEILLQAKRYLQGGDEKMDTKQDENLPFVRMEFIGESVGARTFTVNGRSYRGGRNPLNRYIDARLEDVEKLLSMGLWGRVPQPAQAAQQAQVEAALATQPAAQAPGDDLPDLPEMPDAVPNPSAQELVDAIVGVESPAPKANKPAPLPAARPQPQARKRVRKGGK